MASGPAQRYGEIPDGLKDLKISVGGYREQDFGTVGCSQCGGPVSVLSPRCSYCGSFRRHRAASFVDDEEDWDVLQGDNCVIAAVRRRSF